MTQQEKQLLLKDLCSRLPYEVKIATQHYNHCDIIILKGIVGDRCYFNNNPRYDGDCSIDEVKPYLRPMSSMTEEEKLQLKEEQLKDTRLFADALTKAAEGDTSMRGKVIPHFAADWCNKNHFDFCGLIPMGLALEAKEGMYKTE